ncbi:MAG: hypothetical protein KIG42_01410 [Paludibacteraceae bacterium]|nr:hypothetical protein [Paludibacteraceae bacterium]
MKINNILLALLLLFLSGVIAVTLVFGVSTTGQIQEQQITFNGSKKRHNPMVSENVDLTNQIQSRGAIGAQNAKYAGQTTFRAPSLKSGRNYSGSYVRKSDLLADNGGSTSAVMASNSAYGRTGGNGRSGSESNSMLAPVASRGSAASIEPYSGNIFYLPQNVQATDNGQFTGVNRAYTSTITEVGAPISSLSAAYFTGEHTHVDLDGDGFCDGDDGYYLDYRPGEGTGEFEEVWVPLDADWILLIISLFSLLITYQKIQK